MYMFTGREASPFKVLFFSLNPVLISVQTANNVIGNTTFVKFDPPCSLCTDGDKTGFPGTYENHVYMYFIRFCQYCNESTLCLYV